MKVGLNKKSLSWAIGNHNEARHLAMWLNGARKISNLAMALRVRVSKHHAYHERGIFRQEYATRKARSPTPSAIGLKSLAESSSCCTDETDMRKPFHRLYIDNTKV